MLLTTLTAKIDKILGIDTPYYGIFAHSTIWDVIFPDDKVSMADLLERSRKLDHLLPLEEDDDYMRKVEQSTWDELSVLIENVNKNLQVLQAIQDSSKAS